MNNNDGAHDKTGLTSLGMANHPWQELLEKAYATGQLEVIGELEGGQLLSFEDTSGATLTILTAAPYSVFAHLNNETRTEVELSMLGDTLALLEVRDDDSNALCEITANLTQGPLLVDEPTHVTYAGISALALDMKVYANEEEFMHSGGKMTGFVMSRGAAIVNSHEGTHAPDAAGTVSLTVTKATLTTNSLTEQQFWKIKTDAPFDLNLSLPANGDTEVKPGNVVAGTVLFTASGSTPPSCGENGGGCGNGNCGCGGHG